MFTAVLALAAVGCTPQPQDGDRSGADLPKTERNGPAGAVPVGLEEFYSQEIVWEECPDYASTDADREAYSQPGLECAQVEVPLDYAKPQDATIKLGVLRRPAEGGQRIGSLLINPGGPGASGMSAAAYLADTVSRTELGERFDLVGFDPRGVGASEPQVRCLTDEEWDAERLDSDADVSPSGVAQTEREEQAYARKCAQRSGEELLANIGTREVARDLDVLRSVLGDEKLNYLGYSYGTRIGAEYAEAFPGNVRAMVLDGAIDPEQSTIDSLLEQAAGFQGAFDEFAKWCADQQNCALGNDPSAAVTVYQELTRPLVDRPLAVGDRKLSYSDAIDGTVQALYTSGLWEGLNEALLQLRQGDGRLLLQLADAYYGREPSGSYPNSMDAFAAVNCVDNQRVHDPQKFLEIDRRYREAAPFMDDGRGASPARDACSFWPVPVTGDFDPPEAGQLDPVLVISTTGDPATPYQAGVQLAQVLHGRLLTYEGNQHTVYLQGVQCVDQAATDYLVNLELPPEGTRCR